MSEEEKKPSLLTMGLEDVEVVEVEPSANYANNYPMLRLEAMATYISDVEGCSIAEVHKHPKFKHISWKTFQSWAQEDEWADKRKRQLQKVKNKIAREIGRKLTDNLYREVCDLYELKDMTASMLKGGEVKARSFEGVAKVMMDINRRLSELAQMVNDKVIDEAGNLVEAKERPNQAAIPTSTVDPKEAREIANLLLERRRAEIRQANGTGSNQSLDNSPETEQGSDDREGEGETSIGTDPESPIG
jgi:hypothetical protein